MSDSLPRAALLLIDWQVGMDDPAWGPPNNPEAEANAARLLAAWRRAGQPIIHVQHLSLEPNSVFRPGQPGCAIKRTLAPAGDEPVIEKHVNSAFIGTDLEARLHRAGITTLVLTGMQTDHCVSTTARMAGNLGFTTYVVSDATATFDRVGPDGAVVQAEEVHRVNLASLHREFATVVSTSDVLESAGRLRAVSTP
jgi:nicotinamidase-related amidase